MKQFNFRKNEFKKIEFNKISVVDSNFMKDETEIGWLELFAKMWQRCNGGKFKKFENLRFFSNQSGEERSGS
jgi:hypothetical protein